MRAATFSLGGERRVGVVDGNGNSVAPFDLPVGEAEGGLLALVYSGADMPRALSEIVLENRFEEVSS